MAEGLPRWHPPRAVLELAELVLDGALPALPAPVPVPDAVTAQARDAGGLLLEDDEGTPVAVLDAAGLFPKQPFTHGPLRSRRRAPGEPGIPVGGLAVPVTGPLTGALVERVARRAAAAHREVLWLVVVGAGRAGMLPPEGLLRAVRGAAADAAGRGAPGNVVAVAVPKLAGRDDATLLADVCRGYGAVDVVLPPPDPAGDDPAGDDPAGDDPAGWHPASGRELLHARRPPSRRGVTVFFTGLSGSGKSTVARGLAERLLDDGRRAVSLLDGDAVRRLLSHGRGFSRADRDLNIRRIGFVAAQITRHGGLAICAPIAPFEAVRREVAEQVREVGDFVLVHVCTPLSECERRDRKGLYARARQGLVPDFTGISSPYEPPPDPDLALDTTGLSVDAAVDRVWRLLLDRGYLAPA